MDEAYGLPVRDDDPVDLYDRAPCGYLSMTPRGVVDRANATLLRWLDYPRHDLVGRPFTNLLSPGSGLYFETHLMPLLLVEGSVQELALEMQRHDGSRLPVLVNATLERSRSGEPVTVRVAIFDATERRRYERELLAAKEEAEAARERSRRISATLQRAILPPQAPTIPGLQMSAAYHPAGDGSVVGGDFYDCFSVGEGRWFLVLGDVCGKGPEAAIVTTLVRYAVRGLATVVPEPTEVLSRVNQILLHEAGGRYCTMIVASLEQEGADWRLKLAVGGHPPALRVAHGAVQEIGRGTGPLVGVKTAPTFKETEFLLSPGETLLLYTDGITEALSETDFYGEERLEDACLRHGSDPAALVEGILGEVLDYQNGLARDDIAILALAPM